MSRLNGASPYKINVRKDGRKYVLYNYDSIAGDRLYHGGAFPFTKEGWSTHTTLKAAEAAAERLQEYLDRQEGTKKPKKDAQ